MSTQHRSESATRALAALLGQLGAETHASLLLAEGQPVRKRTAAGDEALTRTPLARAQLENLLAEPELLAAMGGPAGPQQQWPLHVADKDYTALLQFSPQGTAELHISPAAAATALPVVHAVPLAAAPVLATAAAQPPTASDVGRAFSVPRTEKQQEVDANFVALLREAREQDASDLHLQAGQPARQRIQGRLQPMGEPCAAQTVAAWAQAITPAELQASLTALGYADFAYAQPRLGRFRVNVSRQASGMKICMRLVPQQAQSLELLGLPADIEAVTHYHQGLAIVSGPKGHGKTTTLASLVDAINRQSAVHIITVEDPIEVVHENQRAQISQRQIGLHTKSFARALKAALREDPDVIVIGELRDRETVEIALTAAETGHLVLATMSTRSAAKTVDRLIDLFPPDDQQQVRATLAGALKMVISQRLLPAVHGGRVAAVELLTGSVPLWTLIRENKMFQLPSLQQRGRSMGMIRLDAALETLLAAGTITASEALRVCEQPAEMRRVLKEKFNWQPGAADAPEHGSPA